MKIYFFKILYRLGVYNFREYMLSLNFSKFEKKKTLFIHIPKTAGISVYNAIYEDDSSKGHLSIQEYYDFFGNEKVKSLFSFAIVRNPYERLFSAYSYLKKGGLQGKYDKHYQKQISKYNSFEDFVLNFFATDEYKGIDHFLPQFYWVSDRKGNIAVNYIGYFENLEEEFEKIQSLAYNKSNYLSLKWVNKTADKKILNLTPEMIKIINKVYKEDFRNFNYNELIVYNE